MRQFLLKLDSGITHTYQLAGWPNSGATVSQELAVIIFIIQMPKGLSRKGKKYKIMFLWTARTDETVAGGNAVENIMKKYSKVKVSHRYRTKISKKVIKERNLKHDRGHKRYSARV